MKWYRTYIDYLWITEDGKHVKRTEIYHNGKSHNTSFSYKLKERIWNEEDFSGYGTHRYYKVCGELVHRLAASAKYGGILFNEGDCVDHIDNDKHNNSFCNLKICSYTENMNNPITVQRRGKRRWINKDNKVLFVKEEKLEKYLNEGWKIGNISTMSIEEREKARQRMILMNRNRKNTPY